MGGFLCHDEAGMNGQQVGQQFVRVYFKTFFNNPKNLLSLYKEESTFTRGEGKDVVTYKGLKEIETALEGLQANCLVDVRNVVIQDSLENYIVTVTGLFRDTVADSHRAFTQVFLLHPQQPKGLFVLNEIFLYADHEEDDTDDRNFLDVGAPTPEEKEEPVPAKESEVVAEVTTGRSDAEPESAAAVPESSEVVAKEPQAEEKPQEVADVAQEAVQPVTEEAVPQEVAGVPVEEVQAKEEAKKEINEVPKKTEEKPFSWDTVHKDKKKLVAAPNKPGPAASPSQKPPTSRPAVRNSPGPAPAKGETRYVEVSNFDPSANKDVLKKAFGSYGVVKYVSFQGQQRAILEFETADAASSVLSAKSVKVDDKLVRVAPSSAPPPRNNSSRGKSREAGARGGRGGNRTPKGNTRGANKPAEGRPYRNSGNSQQ